MLERVEVLRERHPVQHLGAEECHAKRIALPVADKFLQRLDRLVGAPAVAVLGRHTAGHVEHQLDVGQHPLRALAEWPLRPGEQDDRHRQQQRGEQVRGLDRALEPAAASSVGVVEWQRHHRAAPAPFPDHQ